MKTATMPSTVLLVDDDADCRLLVRDVILRRCGDVRIVEAGNGVEAARLLRGGSSAAVLPDLIYLDLEMPGMGGQELLKIIKDDPALRKIPVVIMTGLDETAQKLQAANHGANSYVVKSVRAERFLQTVSDCVDYWLGVHEYPSEVDTN